MKTYRVGVKRRLLVEQFDRDENDNGRTTPIGSIVEIVGVHSENGDRNRFQVECEETGGWWILTAEELDAETEAVQ
jgi:hypothetical protein